MGAAVTAAGPAPGWASPDDARNRRVIAAFIDLFVVFLSWVAAGLLLNPGEAPAHIGIPIAAWVSAIVYYIVLEAVFGQTIGKAIMAIRVVDRYQQHPTVGRIIGRNVIRPLDHGILGLAAIALTPGKRQRIGDMAGGTYVVRTPQLLLPRNPGGSIAIIGFLLALIPAAVMLTPGHAELTQPDEAWHAQRAANAYLTAAVDGNTTAACHLMSPGEKRAVVARATHD
jgi:uncharacterized RDD family membrane protein YckC